MHYLHFIILKEEKYGLCGESMFVCFFGYFHLAHNKNWYSK